MQTTYKHNDYVKHATYSNSLQKVFPQNINLLQMCLINYWTLSEKNALNLKCSCLLVVR